MNSQVTERFLKCYAKLPEEIKKQAKEAYRQFRADPYHPSLHYKQVHSSKPIFSVRVTQNYRAVGIVHRNDILRFWIGSHSDYSKLLRQTENQ